MKKCRLPIYLLATFTLLGFSTVGFSLDQNIVGLWLFDGGSGNTALDSSDYGNDGKIKGGAEWVDGVFKKALSFNGTDAYVEVPSSDSLKIEGEITIEFWLYLRSIAVAGEKYELLRKHRTADNSLDYSVIVDRDGSIWLCLDPLNFYEAKAAVLEVDYSLNKWTHLAFTYDGKEVVLYINGQPTFEESAIGEIPTSDDPLYIGCRDGTTRYLDGSLDEFCLSNIARTADEIKAHFEKGVVGATAVEKLGKLGVTWAALKEGVTN